MKAEMRPPISFSTFSTEKVSPFCEFFSAKREKSLIGELAQTIDLPTLFCPLRKILAREEKKIISSNIVFILFLLYCFYIVCSTF
jgi:uncharacterized protein involved in cysteine biosynthesis